MLDITTRAEVVKEPQRNYLYYVVVEVGPMGSMSITPGSKDGDYYFSKYMFWTDVDFYNEEAFFPEEKTAVIDQSWAGQKFHLSGVDDSEKSGQLVFTDDEEGQMFKYWKMCQQLTGSEGTHAPNLSLFQNMQIGIAKVDVTKKKITSYSRLVRTKVVGVKPSDPKKSDTGLSTITVSLVWDWCEYDDGLRGKDVWVK